MDKKELKFYEAPACEVVELKLQGVLCASDTPETNPFHGMSPGDEEPEE